MKRDLEDYFSDISNIITERETKLKQGSNVIHLRFLSQHISPGELLELELDAESLGLQLSAMDRSGIPQNSISSLYADLLLMISEPSIAGILTSGMITNGIYDGLKALIIKCWKKVYGKQTVQLTSTTVIERPSKFHIILKVDENRSVELKTENLEFDSLNCAIDKISVIARELGTQQKTILLFDKASMKWNPIKVDIDFLKLPEKITREIPLEEYLEEMRKRGNPHL